jgi:hypothetical protein
MSQLFRRNIEFADNWCCMLMSLKNEFIITTPGIIVGDIQIMERSIVDSALTSRQQIKLRGTLQLSLLLVKIFQCRLHFLCVLHELFFVVIIFVDEDVLFLELSITFFIVVSFIVGVRTEGKQRLLVGIAGCLFESL